MIRMIQGALVALILTGCSQTREQWRDTLLTPGLLGVQALVDRGDIAWDGRGEPGEVQVHSTLWSRGPTPGAAARRADAVVWDLWYADRWLQLDATVPSRRTGIDFAMTGPARVDLDLIAAEGIVDMAWVHGLHVVTADAISGWAVAGEVDLFAVRGGVDVAFHPDPASSSLIQADGGDLALQLPPHGDYTLEAWLDPRFGGMLAVPGLHVVRRGPDYVLAVSGTGEAYIETAVFGGGLFVEAADPEHTPVRSR